jgi:hypothetical protein
VKQGELKECAACKNWFEILDRCHIATRASTGNNFDEIYLVHMCRICHQAQHHIGWKRFTEKYPHVINILRAKGWELVDEFGVWKIRKI